MDLTLFKSLLLNLTGYYFTDVVAEKLLIDLKVHALDKIRIIDQLTPLELKIYLDNIRKQNETSNERVGKSR